jgi:hypothetical protein
VSEDEGKANLGSSKFSPVVVPASSPSDVVTSTTGSKGLQVSSLVSPVGVRIMGLLGKDLLQGIFCYRSSTLLSSLWFPRVVWSWVLRLLWIPALGLKVMGLPVMHCCLFLVLLLPHLLLWPPVAPPRRLLPLRW